MYSRERRDSEVTAILKALGKAETRELTQFVESEALRLDRHEFIEMVRDIYKRIREEITK